MRKTKELVSFFGSGTGDKSVLGGKGFNLDEMVKLGIRVPEGFTLTTEAYKEWAKQNTITPNLRHVIQDGIMKLEEITQRRLGEDLFVSVRSGAPESMPGMMETLLNVGSTDESVARLAEEYNNPTFAYQTYRDFMQGFMKVVRGEEISIEYLASRIRCPDVIRYFCSYELEYNSRYLNNSTYKIDECKKEAIRRTMIDTENGNYILSKNRMKCPDIEFEGLNVEECKKGNKRQGQITLVTEDHIQVLWKDNYPENIPLEKLHNPHFSTGENEKRRKITFLPEILIGIEDYLEERKSAGQFIPDMLRIRKYLSDGIPNDPLEQILEATSAVFSSWNGTKAREYRDKEGISHKLGTAVNIQRMVFANISNESGTAVVFSSCPATGKKGITGEYILGQQGEALVGGNATPQDMETLKTGLPEVYQNIAKIAGTLEQRNRSIQDIEVTWEIPKEGAYFLQKRDAKISPPARISFLLRQYHEGQINKKELIREISLEDYEQIANSEALDVPQNKEPFTIGKPVLEKIISGKLAFNMEELKEIEGKSKIIYCRKKTDTNDIEGIIRSDGLLTTTGGKTCHAAIVALSLGKACVVGCESASIHGSLIHDNDNSLNAGEYVTIDGYTGKVYEGILQTKKGRTSPEVEYIAGIARSIANGLPEIYTIQCLDDLEYIRERKQTHNTQVIYNIDFDCFNLTGMLQDETQPKKVIKKKIEEQAINVYKTITMQCDNAPILKIEGTFDNKLEQAGLYPAELQKWFVYGCAEAAKEEGTKVTLINEKTGRKLYYSMRNLNKTIIHQTKNYKNGTNCVLISPWAAEESYVIAAKEVILK